MRALLIQKDVKPDSDQENISHSLRALLIQKAKGCPTTEKEKVAEKTPQKRVKVIVENAAETAIETVRQK